MKEIESISDLAACTDISLLKEQRQAYDDVIALYRAKRQLCAGVMHLMETDKDFRQFMALYVASQTLTARIKELEGKTND